MSNASEPYLEGNRQSIQEIIDYNPTMAQKIYEFIQDVIDKFKTAMGKDTGIMNISQLRKAEKLWSTMLDETIKDNEARTEVKGDVKYSIKDNPYNEKNSILSKKMRSGKNSITDKSHGYKNR